MCVSACSPITSTSPASQYVGIDQAITYGDTTILAATAGITDTGSTLLLLATDAFDAYKSATGAVADESTGLLKITQDQYAGLQSLLFHIGSVRGRRRGFLCSRRGRRVPRSGG